MSIFAELWDSLVVKVLATVIASILMALAYHLFRRLYRAFRALRLVEAALGAVARRQENGLWTEGPGFWLKLPIKRPANYDNLRGNSIPILMIAATKGGVGKTSLAGSLAAHFATKCTRRTRRTATKRPKILFLQRPG